MIKIRDIKKSFGKVKVLQGINVDIEDGGIFSILGPNGSGKTTLIKIILGMVIPDSGSIEIDGKNILGQWKYRDRIDYMPQIADFPSNLRVNELIKMIKTLRQGTSHEGNLIKIFGLEPFLDKKLGYLSGGTRQKVNIVLALMFDSDIIILDEPTTGLDPVSLLETKKIIRQKREEGKTILITSHIMSFVEELSDQIVFILDGKIRFKGSVQHLKEETDQPSLEKAIAHVLNNEND